jgi:hypothetical protein
VRCASRENLELDLARQDCDNALEINAIDTAALAARGVLNLRTGANQEAWTDFDAAIFNGRSDRPHTLRARRRFACGWAARARAARTSPPPSNYAGGNRRHIRELRRLATVDVGARRPVALLLDSAVAERPYAARTIVGTITTRAGSLRVGYSPPKSNPRV